jgi:hypothetical protein
VRTYFPIAWLGVLLFLPARMLGSAFPDPIPVHVSPGASLDFIASKTLPEPMMERCEIVPTFERASARLGGKYPSVDPETITRRLATSRVLGCFLGEPRAAFEPRPVVWLIANTQGQVTAGGVNGAALSPGTRGCVERALTMVELPEVDSDVSVAFAVDRCFAKGEN